MDKKTTDVVAYITFIGWIVAICAGDKENSKFHLNQSLAIWIVAFVGGIVSGIISGVGSFIPGVGVVLAIMGTLLSSAIGIFCFVCMIMGIISANNGQEKELPLVSMIKIIK